MTASLSSAPSPSLAPMLTAFGDEVKHTQQTFRNLLTAMSEPATILTLEQPADNAVHIQQVHQTQLTALWGVAQTLLDSEVSVFVDEKLPDTFSRSIRFFTGALLVDNPSQAEYIFTHITSLEALLTTYEINTGTLEKPHTNTTVVVQVEALSNSVITPEHLGYLQVTGPGIESMRQLSIVGLTDNLVAQLRVNQQLFPCGIDWIFCAANQLTALPRTSQVALVEHSS